jgi:polar amino acid transport system permease protein
MNQLLDLLRNTRASNLIFLVAAPIIIFFIATSRNYGPALVAVLGIEDQAPRLFISFILFSVIGILGFFSAWYLLSSIRPDQSGEYRGQLRRRASTLLVLQTFCCGVLSQSSAIDPYIASIAANAYDPRSVDWIVIVNQKFVLDPIFQERIFGWVHATLLYLTLILAVITALTFFIQKFHKNKGVRIFLIALGLSNFAFAFYIIMIAYAGFAVGIMVTLRAAFFAYLGASALGMVWALFTRLKPSKIANIVIFLLGILCVVIASIHVFKPKENVALVGELSGKIGIISGIPQHVTDIVRYGEFLVSAPEKPFKVRSLKSIEQAKTLLKNGNIGAVILPLNEVSGSKILWETSYLGTFNKKVGISLYILGFLLILLVGIGKLTSAHPLTVFSDFFVDTIRGIPMLVIILYVGLPLAGAIKSASSGIIDMQMMTRGIIAIAIGYSAYMAEIFRAGIEAIPKGQIESARTLGMREWHVARFIIIPQAIAIVLPALGNEFIAMLKDTSLVSILSVRDITQRMREFQAKSFLAFEPFNSAALIYIILTLIAASGIKSLDKIVNKSREH